jgi:hypothetical protein
LGNGILNVITVIWRIAWMKPIWSNAAHRIEQGNHIWIGFRNVRRPRHLNQKNRPSYSAQSGVIRNMTMYTMQLIQYSLTWLAKAIISRLNPLWSYLYWNRYSQQSNLQKTQTKHMKSSKKWCL